MEKKMKKLLDLFNEHALRPILAAGKEKVDQAFDGMSSSLLADTIKDAYEQIANPTAGLSAQLNPVKIVQAVETVKAQLQKPTVSLLLAHGLKQLVNTSSKESLESALFSALPNSGIEAQLIAQIVIAQLDNLKNTSADELAAQIQNVAANLPTQDVAEQINSLIQAAPKLIMPRETPDLLSQLPEPQVIVDAAKEVGKALSDTLDNASKGASFDETISALKQFLPNAQEIFTRLSGQDNKPKKAPEKKKGNGKNWDL